MSEYFYESYQVRAYYDDPTWGRDYSTLAEVTIEGSNRQNRGVELGRFKGQDIEIALRMISENGDAIAFDNLQFRGCTQATVGVGTVARDGNLAMKVAGKKVMVSEVANITVTDTNGRTVAMTKGNTIDLSRLSAGMYVVKATSATGTATMKVVR